MELLAYNDDAAVVVVLSEWLNGVAIRANFHTVSRNATLLELLGHLFCTGLGIAFVDARITCAAVSISLDGYFFVGILVTPCHNAIQSLLRIRIRETNVVEEYFLQRLILHDRLWFGLRFRLWLYHRLGSWCRSRSGLFINRSGLNLLLVTELISKTQECCYLPVRIIIALQVELVVLEVCIDLNADGKILGNIEVHLCAKTTIECAVLGSAEFRTHIIIIALLHAVDDVVEIIIVPRVVYTETTEEHPVNDIRCAMRIDDVRHVEQEVEVTGESLELIFLIGGKTWETANGKSAL
jgi:hypothetical protein